MEQFFPLELTLVLPSLQAFPVNPESRPAGSSLASHVSGVRKQADSPVLRGQSSNSNDGLRSQVNMLLTHPAPLQDANSPPEAPPAWPAGRGDGHIIRFTRTVNSLPNGNPVCSAVPGVCFFPEGRHYGLGTGTGLLSLSHFTSLYKKRTAFVSLEKGNQFTGDWVCLLYYPCLLPVVCTEIRDSHLDSGL